MESKVNEIKISYKQRIKSDKWCQLKCSSDTAKFIFEHWDKNTIGIHESFKILLLNNANKVKGIYQVSSGGITGTIVDLRLLFAVVLKSLATGVLLVHNHPSGTLKASLADIQLTRKIKNAAELFDIRIIDHLIITPSGAYYSFADNSIL
ncbi:JAB domain-containing protein [Flavivirga jejuensis]|uniref:JAB domain-containing protein n=1 Tax=Flavivirga jejuensis TaxID=870487 RepID=A0ABT8WUW9_9FLAO|nr:JAB domain-containing protein [Flavivirga jejuensis]MDO5976939.1 JAB domain-containing protein [Flavivirga jejuensis]